MTEKMQVGPMRTFESGALRNSEEGKLDYEGFLSPLVLRRYAEYLHSHRALEDGTTRDSDNWQQGMPREVYMKSFWRHMMDWWTIHRWRETGRLPNRKPLEDAICGVIFNASGYLHELLKEKSETKSARTAEAATQDHALSLQELAEL